MTIALCSIGGMLGGYLCGWLADRLGRKGALMANNGIAIVAVIVFAVAKPSGVFYLLIVGRFIIGINCGLS